MIQLTAKGKFIDTAAIEHLFTQGERYSDRIRILVDTINNEVDVSDCTFVMRSVACDGSMTETLLPKTTEDTQISLLWEIPAETTAVAGMLRLELVASKEASSIIKYKMPPVFIKKAVMGGNLPIPDVLDTKLAMMNEILEDASELSEQIASTSGPIQEVIDARKGTLVANTFASLAARLSADFNACITQGELEKAIGNAIITAVENATNSGVGRFYLDDDGNVCGEVFNNYSDCEAPGEFAHAGGGSAHAEGYSAFAHGDTAIANGVCAIALGQRVAAYAPNSAAIGRAVQAHAEYQHVYGAWGVHDTEGKYSFIFANGTDETHRSNGLTLTRDSILYAAKDVTTPARDGSTVSLRGVQESVGMRRKNLLRNSSGTMTQNGITFTRSEDGSVTCSGTATADTNYRYILSDLLPDTDYILSGCPSGGSTTTYNLFIMDSASWSKIYRDTGSSVTFNTGDNNGWHAIIRIAAGQTVDGLTFSPMLRYADVTDGTYEPYVDDLQTQINALKAAIVALGGTVSAADAEINMETEAEMSTEASTMTTINTGEEDFSQTISPDEEETEETI